MTSNSTVSYGSTGFSDQELRVSRQCAECDLCLRPIHRGEPHWWQAAWRNYQVMESVQCAHCEAACRLYDLYNDASGDGIERADVYYWSVERDGGSVAELRDRVHFSREWTRPDGTLYDIPGKPGHNRIDHTE